MRVSPALLLVVTLVVGVAFISGCGKEPPPPPVVQAPPPPPPPLAPPAPKPIQLAALAPVTLEAGGQVAVDLRVSRNGNEGPIQFAVAPVPEGITAKPTDAPQDQSAGKLELSAASTLGDKPLTASLTIMANVGQQKATQTLSLTVPELGLPKFASAAEVLLQPGTSRIVTLTIQRARYQGPMELRVEAAPPTVTCQVGPIAAGQTSAPLMVTAAGNAVDGAQSVRVAATLFGRSITVDVPVKIDANPFVVNAFRAVQLKPGETQKIEIPVERRSYKGALQIKPAALPTGLAIKSMELAPNQDKAFLEISAAPDAVPRVHSSKIVSTGGHLTSTGSIVIRIAGGDETYLPPNVIANPEVSALLRRGSIGGRLTAESKQALVDFYGGTPESEAAVMRGLRWLAAHQQPDGSWLLKDYAKGIAGCDCQGEGEKEVEDNITAGTAFGILPFLGAGVTHKGVPSAPAELANYKQVVEKALVYLAKNQKRSQDKNDGHLGGSMYAHAFGTIALCEAFGLSGDERVKVNAQLALKYLLNAQHATGGGWRYGPGQAGDMSVTGWVFLGIRSAQLSGIDVLKPPLIRAARFVDSCAAGPPDAKLSQYAYEPGQPPKLALSAAGLLTREYLLWPKDEPNLEAGCKYLMQNLPPESGSSLGAIYYYYYATQVLHHLEGPNFDLWNHRMREHLIRTQEKTGHKTGSWNPAGADHGARGGRMYATSLALLTLEVYYRHLPMYRVVKRMPAKAT